jgi:hypothetical protein
VLRQHGQGAAADGAGGAQDGDARRAVHVQGPTTRTKKA